MSLQQKIECKERGGTVSGDLSTPFFEDDRVTLYHGDANQILPALEADVVITDPPYGVREDEEWDNMSQEDFARFSMQWLSVARSLVDEMVVFCVSDSSVRDLCRMIWPRVRSCVWDKPVGSQYTGASERGMWFTHETILHCYVPNMAKSLEVAHLLRAARESVGLSKGGVDMVVRGKKTGLCYRWEEGACLPSAEQVAKIKEVLPLNGDFTAALDRAYGRKNDGPAEGRDVFSYRTETNTLHSCQKPFGLMSELVQRITEKGQTILDPFAGSGTTLLAAAEHGRKAIGIEQDEKHCETIAKRFAQMTLKL